MAMSQPVSAQITSKAFNLNLRLLNFQVGLQNSCDTVREIWPFTCSALHSLSCLSDSQGCSPEEESNPQAPEGSQDSEKPIIFMKTIWYFIDKNHATNIYGMNSHMHLIFFSISVICVYTLLSRMLLLCNRQTIFRFQFRAHVHTYSWIFIYIYANIRSIYQNVCSKLTANQSKKKKKILFCVHWSQHLAEPDILITKWKPYF